MLNYNWPGNVRELRNLIERIAILDSNNDNEKIEINVKLGTSNKIDSITQIYPGAEWQEREVFDMFGIEFKNHPKLERILMPDDWIGYPLLKD